MNSGTIDLNPQRWARVEELFDEAAELPADERPAFLNAACKGDSALREYIASLLDSDMAESTIVEESIKSVLAAAVPGVAEGEDNAGRRIGPYRIVRGIGTGGMGVVYLAERADGQFEQQVAIKVVRQRLLDPDVKARLRAERQILANLDHPNIARLFDGGTLDDGTPYLVMEYIDGVPIDEYCDRHRLDIESRLELFDRICAAIHHAHQNLVVHRDIKASNILVTSDGVPKLLDFGIARLLDAGDAAATAGLTRVGAVILTPESAAPEQVSGGSITTATDVYALGVLLYRLLTGTAPYELSMSRPADIPRIILESEPPPPSVRVRRPEGTGGSGTLALERTAERRGTTVDRLSRRLRGDLDNIVQMALRKEPERRYRTVNAFSEDLRRHLSFHPVVARPDTWRYRTSTFLRRHTAIAAMSASIAALLVTFAVAVTIQNYRIAEERDKALQISTFLEEIFMEPDPGNARGASITAREILEKGAARIATQLDGRPAIQAALMSTIGRVYYDLGEYDSAVETLEESLRIQQQTLGNNDADVAADKTSLAAALTLKAEYDRAVALFEESLSERRRLHGTGSPEVAETLYFAAEAYYSSGRSARSEEAARHSIDIYSALEGDYSAEIARDESLLARILQDRHELDEAESLLRSAIDRVRGSRGEDHPEMTYYMQNLAVVLQAKGDLDGAERLYAETIELTRRVLGDNHSHLANTFAMIGQLHRQRRDYEKAEEAFREALRVDRVAFRPDHPHVAYDMVSLGMLLHDMGNLGEAESQLRQALEIYDKSLSPNHQYTASALTQLGYVLTDAGKADAAEPLLERAIEIRRRDYDPEHPLLAATLSIAGYNQMALKRYEQAESLLVESYPVLREQVGENDQRAQRVQGWIADLYERSGRPKDAASYRTTAQKTPL